MSKPDRNRRVLMQLLAGSSVFALVSMGRAHASTIPDFGIGNTVFASDQSAQSQTVYHFTRQIAPPEIRIFADGTDNIRKFMHWIREEKRDFATLSGGHCFGGLSYNSETILDLRNLKSVNVNVPTRTVEVEAGTPLIDVLKATEDHKLDLVMGSHGTVAMGGHTLAGGIGYLSRRLGMMCDKLDWIDLILADGTEIRASEAENSDLFWACKGGGGGQFGVARRMQFQLEPTRPAHFFNTNRAVSPTKAAEILLLYQFVAVSDRPDISIDLNLSRRGDNQILVRIQGYGDLDKPLLGTELRYMLREDNDKILDELVSDDWSTLARARAEGNIVGPSNLLSQSYNYNDVMKPETIVEFVASLFDAPAGAVHTSFIYWGGAIGNVGITETAFPHRNAKFIAHTYSDIKSGQRGDMQRQHMVKTKEILARDAVPGVYVGYPDLTLENWAAEYWGPNLSRLKRIKSKYDPDNVFDHAQSLARA